MDTKYVFFCPNCGEKNICTKEDTVGWYMGNFKPPYAVRSDMKWMHNVYSLRCNKCKKRVDIFERYLHEEETFERYREEFLNSMDESR